jgi:hypothetical protein
LSKQLLGLKLMNVHSKIPFDGSLDRTVLTPTWDAQKGDPTRPQGV